MRCWLLGHSWFPTPSLPICLRCGRFQWRGKALRVVHGPVIRILAGIAQSAVERRSA
jgi:hypothetical protein